MQKDMERRSISRKLEGGDYSADCGKKGAEERAKRVEEHRGVTLLPTTYKIYSMVWGRGREK